ncbi:MAG: hypothetical protein E6J41_09550 [Chloroflexi bacterium]|nr:MAG: hypothetical protein E6J41_09550 [Chloroflexota bacterium]
MAPATSDVLAGIPAAHLPGLVGGLVAVGLGFAFRGRLDVLSALLLCTAGVHLGLALGHASTAPVLSVLFVLDGLAYLGLLALRRGRWWRRAAAALLLATIVAYLVYVGSGREAPEPVGLADKLVEVVALGLVLVPRRRTGRWRAASFATLAVAFLAGGVMWIEDLAGAGHLHGVAAVCVANHHPGPGAVLRPVPCTVTPEQQAAADGLVAETRQGIARYQDVRVALAAGYRPSTPDGSGTAHYTDFRAPANPLDPSHPAALVYATTRHGPVLLGAMYQMPKQGVPGPDLGGALTPWHYHTNVCFSVPGLLVSGLSTPFGMCPPGSVRITTADQLHVWTAPNPNGPFGDLDEAWVRRLAGS